MCPWLGLTNESRRLAGWVSARDALQLPGTPGAFILGINQIRSLSWSPRRLIALWGYLGYVSMARTQYTIDVVALSQEHTSMVY
jgi:hypothetical protein